MEAAEETVDADEEEEDKGGGDASKLVSPIALTAAIAKSMKETETGQRMHLNQRGQVCGRPQNSHPLRIMTQHEDTFNLKECLEDRH